MGNTNTNRQKHHSTANAAMGSNEQMGRGEGIQSTLEVHDRLLRGQDASIEAERAEKHVNFSGNGPSKDKTWGREKMARKGNIELLRARDQGTHGAMDPWGPPWVMGAM